MRSFIVIGRTATASSDFSLEDLPSSSGRLDVLLRCVRAALLYSHGLRTDVRVYLVLRGSPLAPRVLRIDAATARFIRPDERSLAVLVKKTLGAAHESVDGEFVELRPGISLARGDLDCVLSELGGAQLYLLDEHAPDVRELGRGTQGGSGEAAYFRARGSRAPLCARRHGDECRPTEPSFRRRHCRALERARSVGRADLLMKEIPDRVGGVDVLVAKAPLFESQRPTVLHRVRPEVPRVIENEETHDASPCSFE